MMGGTRFIGIYLARQLIKEGHKVTLFTRGKSEIAFKLNQERHVDFEEYKHSIQHIQGDRKQFDDLKSKIANKGFDVVYDINGREASEVEPILQAIPNLSQYIYCSSAGVYLKSEQMPHREEDAVDPASRHKGKLDTEELLRASGVNFTSIRPVYIYGPLNYNPVEEWFFQRVKAGRPIPVPGQGRQLTQLGHVSDLADAFVKCLDNPKAQRQIYNISGERYVTFSGIARLCAQAMGVHDVQLVHYDPASVDLGKKKAFPMRDQHFFASIDKAQADLGWTPQYPLLDGLINSYENDFKLGQQRKEPNFEADDIILKSKGY